MAPARKAAASVRLPTGITSIPSTTAASFALAAGTTKTRSVPDFAYHGIVVQPIRRKLAAGDQQTQRDRQVEGRRLFGELRRGQIDDDAFKKSLIAGIRQSAFAPMTTFAHRGVGQTDQHRMRVGGRGEVDFHFNRMSVDAQERECP